MKNSIYSSFLALLVLLSFTACKKDVAPVQHNNSTKSTIDGKWSLIRLYGGIAGVNENHAAGEIEWTFNSQNSTLGGISGNQLLMDDNKKSTGEGACGFYLVLER